MAVVDTEIRPFQIRFEFLSYVVIDEIHNRIAAMRHDWEQSDRNLCVFFFCLYACAEHFLLLVTQKTVQKLIIVPFQRTVAFTLQLDTGHL